MDDIKTRPDRRRFRRRLLPEERADMYMARQLLRAAGSTALLIAKIERVEASPTWKKSSMPPTASWSPAAISPSKSAMPRCRRCRRK
jgi:hypothetical protein